MRIHEWRKKARADNIVAAGLVALCMILPLILAGCAGTTTMIGSKCFGDASMCGSIKLQNQLMSDNLTDSEAAQKKLGDASADEKSTIANRLSTDLVDALAYGARTDSTDPLGIVNDLAGSVIDLAFAPLSLIGAHSTPRNSRNYKKITSMAPDALVSIGPLTIPAMAQVLTDRDDGEVRSLAAGHPPPTTNNQDVVGDLSRARGVAGVLGALSEPSSPGTPRPAEELGIGDKNGAAVANFLLTPNAPAVANIPYSDSEKQSMLDIFKKNDARISEVVTNIFMRIGPDAIPALNEILQNGTLTDASRTLGRKAALINSIAAKALAQIGAQTAAAAANKVKKVNPEDPEKALTAEQHLVAASGLIDRRAFDQAQLHLQQAGTMLPLEDWHRVIYHQRVGLIFFEKRDFGNARTAFMDSIRLAQRLGVSDPSVADAYAGMGYCLMHENKRSYAARFLKKSLESDPSSRTRERVSRQLKKLQDGDSL